MIGVLVVTHGGLADELVAAARVIASCPGDVGIRALSLDWRIGLEEARERIAAAARQADLGEGVLVLTDMFGDTPSRAALALCKEGRIEVVSGVNLPMVVRLACNRGGEGSLGEIASLIAEKGRSSICRSAGREASAPISGEDRRG